MVFSSIVLMLLQNLLGGKFFIPNSFLPQTYNYYRTIEELNFNDQQKENMTCPICLGILVNPANDSSLSINTDASGSDQFFEEQNRSKFSYMVVKLKGIIDRLRMPSREKPYMITPCNHIFHTLCLKPWHEHKQDCPMCRLALPILEEN